MKLTGKIIPKLSCLLIQFFFSSHVISFLPTALIIGLILWSMRRASNVMGSARKGGGIFGMGESTAKLINPKDIPVKFKYYLNIIIYYYLNNNIL